MCQVQHQPWKGGQYFDHHRMCRFVDFHFRNKQLSGGHSRCFPQSVCNPCIGCGAMCDFRMVLWCGKINTRFKREVNPQSRIHVDKCDKIHTSCPYRNNVDNWSNLIIWKFNIIQDNGWYCNICITFSHIRNIIQNKTSSST